MTDKEKYDFIDHVVHLALFEEDSLLNEYGGEYSGLEEDGIDSNEYYRIITERVINILKKNNNYIQEEPVSEELEKAAVEAFKEIVDDGRNSFLEIFKAGSQWKEQQMMASAVDGVITFDYYGDDNKEYGCIVTDSFCLEDLGLKDKDKVKLIVTK